MKHDEFIAQVRRRLDLESPAAAEQVTQAVLETLSEHMAGREPHNLAAQLPDQVGRYLHHDPTEAADARGERFALEEFYHRVATKASVEMDSATRYAQVVIAVLTDAVTEGEIKSVRAQFPDEYEALFAAPVRE